MNKNFIRKTVGLLIMSAAVFVPFSTAGAEALSPRLVDNAGLLSESEYDNVLEQLDEVSERNNFDIVIVTEDSIGDSTPMEYADDFYDYNYYGYGSDMDGALLLISMENRDWYISTCGRGIIAVTDAGIDYMGDKIVPYMSDGDYEGGFEKFISLCDEFVNKADNGTPYDVENLPEEPFDFVSAIIVALVAGGITGVVVALALKGQLKSVRASGNAADYIVNGSINIEDSRDVFLYSNISRTPKPKNNSSGGGSSTHRSSSGRSHGGGGGHF